MAKKREGSAPQTAADVLQRQVNALQKQINAMRQTGPSSIQPDDWENALSPAPWEVMAHWPGYHPEATPHDNLVYFHPGYTDAVSGDTIVEKGWKAYNDRRVKNIKLFSDTKPNRVDTEIGFRFPVEEDLDKTRISYIQGFSGTAGSGTTSMIVYNYTRDITIAEFDLTEDDGEHSWSDDVEIDDGGLILEPNNMVFEFDWIHVYTSAVASGSKGAGIYIKFS